MLSKPSSLIISSVSDEHTAAVVDCLSIDTVPLVLDFRKYGHAFNSSISLSDGVFCLKIRDRSGNEFDLSEVRTVWWRRPQRFTNHHGLSEISQRFVQGETNSYWRGALSLLEGRWYNHFDCDRLLDRKPFQLDLARKIGFAIPDTCITSSPSDARIFIERHGGDVIFKSFGGSEEFWQPARQYVDEMYEMLRFLPTCPIILQEYIKGIDYRVTIVDKDIFSAAKDVLGTEYPFDVRITTKIPYRMSYLPVDTQDFLLRFMSKAGLNYGAFDLRQDADGKFWFLEVNPAGQFLYIEAQTGFPIAERLGSALSATGGRCRDLLSDDEWTSEKGVFSIDVPGRVLHLR